MQPLEDMINRRMLRLPPSAAAHHPSSAVVVAVAPSWTARRRGRFLFLASRNRGRRTPKGLTPAPDDARGRRGLPRGGLTVVGPAAPPRGGARGAGPPPPPAPARL